MVHSVHSRITRADPSIVARFLGTKFEVVAELVAPSQLVDTSIKPLALRDFRFAGSAVTVALPRASTLMGYAAVGVAQKGDVIVVAARGDCSQASWGGGLTLSAKNLGCAGVVVDGSVVDTTSILSHAVPVFARGATFAHGDNRTPGSVNIPIVCGGVLIQPGDIVLGELDGIIVVPRVDAEAVLVAAEEKTARLRTIAARLRETGETLLDVNGGRGMISDAGVQWVD